jgi:hypothetical protein
LDRQRFARRIALCVPERVTPEHWTNAVRPVKGASGQILNGEFTIKPVRTALAQSLNHGAVRTPRLHLLKFTEERIMSEAEMANFDERCPIWARYTNEPTDRKREQIERVLMNAGARFAVHDIATQQQLPDALSFAFGGGYIVDIGEIDWGSQT